MTQYDRIATLVLDGATASQLRAHYPGLAPATLASYRRDILRALAPEQRAAALAKRAPTPSGGQTPFSDRQPLSPLHRRVGIKLARHRANAGLGVTAFVALHGFANRIRLAEIEAGFANVTLGEMLQIAAILGTDVAGLLEPVAVPVPRQVTRCRR